MAFTSQASPTGPGVNRILSNFRMVAGGERGWLPFLASMELLLLRKGERTFFTQAEQLHAELVLERIWELGAPAAE